MARYLLVVPDGGGNVIVFLELARRLRARGHDLHAIGSASLESRFRAEGIPLTAADGWGPGLGDELPPEVARVQPDAVLLDQIVSRPAHAAAEACGRPIGVIAHTAWSFVPEFDGPDRMHGAGYLDQLARFDRILVFTVEELDDPGVPRLPNVVHVGPMIENEGPDAGWTPPNQSLVVVSLGTTDMGEGPMLQRVLDGLASVPVAVVATAGPHLDVRSLRVPANARVAGLVRHAALFPHADVFVGHGGHGGIMSALAFGVPIVTMPIDRDQPHNARLVERAGAGRTVPKDASPAEIAAAVEAVRTGVREREGAIRMANAIASYGDRAVREVEALVR